MGFDMVGNVFGDFLAEDLENFEVTWGKVSFTEHSENSYYIIPARQRVTPE